MHYTVKRYDYMLLGISLIIIGAIASLDIIINKQQFVDLWMQWQWLPLTPDHVDGYVQILLILLNIFTGSIAAQCLFYSSNKKHF